MKKTENFTGHRWTNDELKLLIELWEGGSSLKDIAEKVGATKYALLKQVQRMRATGIPLKRRKNGHQSGATNRLWTQGETEYLIRRRKENATAEQIGSELNRNPNAVQAFIQKLRAEGVEVPMRGCGVRRLWDAEALKTLILLP